MGVFESSNMIVTVSNIIFFIVVQTMFFYFIASKQFNVVLNNKVGILNEFASRDDELRSNIKAFFASDAYKQIEEAAEVEAEERVAYNTKLIKNWIVPPLLACIALLLIFLIKRSVYNEPWGAADTLGLILVVSAYTTEVLFYLGIVRRFEFYGDIQIYDKIYTNIDKNINVAPETEKGKQIYAVLQLLGTSGGIQTLLNSGVHKKLINNASMDNLKKILAHKGIAMSEDKMKEIEKFVMKNKDNLQEIVKQYFV